MVLMYFKCSWLWYYVHGTMCLFKTLSKMFFLVNLVMFDLLCLICFLMVKCSSSSFRSQLRVDVVRPCEMRPCEMRA